MLKGKNAVITGARTGIGRATVEKLASEGVNIWACAHRENEDFKNDMERLAQVHGVWIEPVYFDLEDEEAVKAALKGIIKEKKPIDILVNNAGVPYGALMQMTPIKELKRIFEINFFSQILITQLITKAMMKQHSGTVVNVASVVGLDGDIGYTAYGSSKAALAFSTKVMAKELATYGIRINAIAPGLIETTMGKAMDESYQLKMVDLSSLKRMGQSMEVANIIAFLLSAEASYITGQIWRIDGGM